MLFSCYHFSKHLIIFFLSTSGESTESDSPSGHPLIYIVVPVQQRVTFFGIGSAKVSLPCLHNSYSLRGSLVSVCFHCGEEFFNFSIIWKIQSLESLPNNPSPLTQSIKPLWKKEQMHSQHIDESFKETYLFKGVNKGEEN